ncbi:MAG: sulfite exporter TauE/SafE family protein [Nanoarchaeota archaeon]|nr:sulfite exporter TauE/SafE family protein [Nanoarchaeota archaeon]
MGIEILVLIVLAAVVMEMIDAGLGMGYGTVLSPLLISLGHDPLIVVPSILFSQAIGGFTASIFHHRFRNVDFKPKSTNIKKIKESLITRGFIESFKLGFTKDFKVMLSITVLGIIATILGVLIAVKIPKWVLTTYIGALVLIMGLLLLQSKTFKFSWKKMMGVGLLASFNKGISGGGFGPVTTGGQVIAGNEHKSSIGCTTLSEAPICITGFVTYILLKGLADYDLLIATSIGAVIGAPFGALLTKKIDSKKLKYILGILITFLGIYVLFQLGTA